MLFSNLMYIQRYQEGKEREKNVVDFFFLIVNTFNFW